MQTKTSPIKSDPRLRQIRKRGEDCRLVDFRRRARKKAERLGGACTPEPQHSPLPWIADEQRLTIRCEGATVADMATEYWGTACPVTIADLRLIVDAVNNRAALMSLLQTVADAETWAQLKEAVVQVRNVIKISPKDTPTVHAV